jgi:hypothetical protein
MVLVGTPRSAEQVKHAALWGAEIAELAARKVWPGGAEALA